MSTLYIDRRGASLETEGEALVVRFDGKRQRPVPLGLLDRVVLIGKVELDSGVLLKLAEVGIVVQLLGRRSLMQQALLLGRGHNNVVLRLRQYRLSQQPDWRLLFCQQLLESKLRGQLRLLALMLAQRPDQRLMLVSAQSQLDALLGQVLVADRLASLLGLEGTAARIGFQAMSRLLPPALGFTGRRRRPPPDPVNACLSLAYTLLHARAVQVLHALGLDPLLGFYHEPAWGRESLASDLIEPWRPYVDEWVWDLFRRQALRAHHFSYQGKACHLGKAGRPIFFARLELLLRPMTRAMRLQVRRLIREMEAFE